MSEFIEFMKKNPVATITEVVEATGYTRNQILNMLRKSFKIEKPHKKEDTLFYRFDGYLPEKYDELQLGLVEPQNTKEKIFCYACEVGQLPTLQEYNEYFNTVFNGSNNSFFSMRRDVRPMLIDNSLILTEE